MKYVLILLLISGSALGKGISFDAFKVDTTTTDLKPDKKEVVAAKAEPVEIDFSTTPKEYRPGSYKPPSFPFSRPSSNFGKNQNESANQSARGNNPNL